MIALSPSKNKELMVILSPDKVDRNTEFHFTSLFEKPPVFVYPPMHQRADYQNPLPHKHSVLVFEGGTDISPSLYKQKIAPRTSLPDTKRDAHEVAYFRMARTVNAACMGICRGAQLLCALSGGELIQDVLGHSGSHVLYMPGSTLEMITTSVHHQMMNPYVLPQSDWASYGTAPRDHGYRFRDQNGNKIKVRKHWKNWEEQEIVWFRRTRSLAIQGHPEYYQSSTALFVQYCRYLLHALILTEDAPDGLPTP